MKINEDVWVMLWAASELVFVLIATAAVYYYVVKRRSRTQEKDRLAAWQTPRTQGERHYTASRDRAG